MHLTIFHTKDYNSRISPISMVEGGLLSQAPPTSTALLVVYNSILEIWREWMLKIFYKVEVLTTETIWLKPLNQNHAKNRHCRHVFGQNTRMSISIFCIMPFCNKLSTIWKQCKYRLYRSTNLHVRSIADVYSEKSEFHWLSNCSPSFIIDGDKVHVLNEPCEFYETLKVLQTLLRRHIYVLQYKP